MKGPSQQLFGCIPFHLCTIHHILCRINAVKELVRSQSPANNSSASRYSPPGTRRSGSGLRCVQQLVADSVVLSARWELRRNPKRLSGSLFVENLYIFCGKYAMQLRNMYKFYTYNGYFLFLFWQFAFSVRTAFLTLFQTLRCWVHATSQRQMSKPRPCLRFLFMVWKYPNINQEAGFHAPLKWTKSNCPLLCKKNK